MSAFSVSTKPVNLANLFDLGFGQLCHTVLLSAWHSLWVKSCAVLIASRHYLRSASSMVIIACLVIASFFLCSVAHVVLVCSKPKMVWINAQRNIAAMQNAKVGWVFCLMSFPRKSVSGNLFRTGSESTVTSPAENAPSPKPAAFRFINVAMEVFQVIFHRRQSCLV